MAWIQTTSEASSEWERECRNGFFFCYQYNSAVSSVTLRESTLCQTGLVTTLHWGQGTAHGANGPWLGPGSGQQQKTTTTM